MELNALQQIRTRIHLVDWRFPVFMLFSRTTLFAIIQTLFVVIFGFSWSESIAWWPFSAIITNIICFFLLSKLVKKEKMNYLDLIHFDKNKISHDLKLFVPVFLIASVVGFIGLFGLSYLMYGTTPPETNIVPLPVWAAIISLFFFPVTNALVETTTYMAYALPRLQILWKSKSAALIVSAFFLAFQHVTLPMTFDITYTTWHFVSMIPLAITVGVLYLKTKRLIPIILVHLIIDLQLIINVVIISF